MKAPGKTRPSLAVALGILLVIGLSGCKKSSEPTARELAFSLPRAEAMSLFDNEGNAQIPRRRITLGDITQNAFALFPGDRLSDKRSISADSFLAADAGAFVTNNAAKKFRCRMSLILKMDDGRSSSEYMLWDTNSGELSPAPSWHPIHFPLQRWSGKNVRLHLEFRLNSDENSSPVSSDDFTMALANPRIKTGSKTNEKLNLIIVNIDTLRPGHLGLFGYHRPTSPQMDSLANECVLFKNTKSQSSWTPPSVASLLTSLYPTQHGSLGKDRIPLSADNITLAEIMKKNGWLTAAFSASPFIHPDFGFGQGFDTFAFERTEHAEFLNRMVESWLERNSDENFFLYIMYFDPHQPYEPPPPYESMFQRDDEGNELWSAEDFKEKKIPLVKLDDRVSRQTFEYLRSLYDGEVAYTDYWLGRLVKSFRGAGILDHSILIITSDHGEEFLDHGRFGHGRTLYEEMLQVLFMLRTPDQGAAGVKVHETVRVIDIMPTALEMLGIRDGLPPIEGKSLAGWLEGPGLRIARPAFATQEHLFEKGRTQRSLEIDGYKLILMSNPDQVELYNMLKDPGEKHSLASSRRDLVLQLTEKITNFEKEMIPTRLGPAANPPAGRTEKLLRSLGYTK